MQNAFFDADFAKSAANGNDSQIGSQAAGLNQLGCHLAALSKVTEHLDSAIGRQVLVGLDEWLDRDGEKALKVLHRFIQKRLSKTDAATAARIGESIDRMAEAMMESSHHE